MARAVWLLPALLLASCETVPTTEDPVQLTVLGPPIAAEETGHKFIYQRPQVPEGMPDDASSAGLRAQGWSMLGREDRGAALGGAEYREKDCEPLPESPAGLDAIADHIAKRAADHRIVIINESHTVTRTRELTRLLLPRLRAMGFTVLSAEAFSSSKDSLAPKAGHFENGWPHYQLGYYSREPAFGRLVRDALTLDYRLATHEQWHDPDASPEADVNLSIANREEAQARNLMAVLDGMGSDERLLVHVGYSHARETAITRDDGTKTEWMAARLKNYTGLDPLTITQTQCRKASGAARLAQTRSRIEGAFDIVVDHPVDTFEQGRAAWRTQRGDLLVPIPATLRPVSAPLVIEAFSEGEPQDAVPMDRVFVEPGEDIALSLPPGRYYVRAVRLDED